MKRWYELNNVGKFYASLTTMNPDKVFRYSATLKEKIDKDVLQNALDRTIGIYPNFNVHLKHGFFWYYLDETKKKNFVEEENLPVCFKLYNSSNDFLYRISYYETKINVEISHIIADGRGAMEFFKTLISIYIDLKYELKSDCLWNDSSLYEKTEDAFDKYFDEYKSVKTTKTKNIYQYKGRKFKNQTQFLECYMPCKQVVDLAHKYNATLSCFLVSLAIYSFIGVMPNKSKEKVISISVPVDLRGFFKSNSSGNFFAMSNIEYKFEKDDVTLDDIIESVKFQFKEKITMEKMKQWLNKMVWLEKHWLCRIAPITMKDISLAIVKRINERKETTSVSNVGEIKLQPTMYPYIEKMSAMIATKTFQYTVCSFNDTLCITISNSFVENDVIKNFCRYLSQNGVDIQIDASEVE